VDELRASAVAEEVVALLAAAELPAYPPTFSV
jgi:hypothetical protein